jgi:hypothetical protein
MKFFRIILSLLLLLVLIFAILHFFKGKSALDQAKENTQSIHLSLEKLGVKEMPSH